MYLTFVVIYHCIYMYAAALTYVKKTETLVHKHIATLINIYIPPCSYIAIATNVIT